MDRERLTPDSDGGVGEELVRLSLLHGSDAGIKWIALFLALLLHVGVLSMDLPEFKSIAPRAPKHDVIIVRRYVPPPPKTEQPPVQRQKQKLTRKVPIPDPTPDEPEPIREPEPEIVTAPFPDDVEVLIGVPEPPGPPSAEPLMAGVGGVTNPVRIDESYVQPEYPEIARMARVETDVILQAVIHGDGSVGDVQVLRCGQPGFGFEDAAIAAVKRWRYEPATQDGEPVEVYFTVFVEFSLL